jgi:hypothetical protein
MGRVAKQGWEKEAIQYFLNGGFNRFHQEKLVALGFMRRFSVPKEKPGRGPNPVKYELTEEGKAFFYGTETVPAESEAPKPATVRIDPAISKANSDFDNFLSNPNWTEREIELIKSNEIPDNIIPACIKIKWPRKRDQIKAVVATLEVQEAIKKYGSWSNFLKKTA